jgi:DNA (cytosine-5)-methyltransferase 1
MNYGSLFAGIGGIDLGLERAGMQCLWQVEWDEYCQKVLARHWPDVKRYGDVEDCGSHNLEPVDLICGGFPCQPVSVAGQRGGDTDDRWLWPEFYRIVCELGPRWVLVENVPGLLSIDSGRLFGGILRDLAQSGYDAEWDCISAAAFGAPHLRYRVFIVAHTQRTGLAQQPGEQVEGWTRDEPTRGSRGPLRKEEMAYAHSQQVYGTPIAWPECNPWTVEPGVDRVAHGVPARVDRLRGLGNAVVPQIAEWIGRWILEAERKANGGG